jgi:hypothetical protein
MRWTLNSGEMAIGPTCQEECPHPHKLMFPYVTHPQVYRRGLEALASMDTEQATKFAYEGA